LGLDSLNTFSSYSPETRAKSSLVKMLNEAVKEEEEKIKNMGKNIKKNQNSSMRRTSTKGFTQYNSVSPQINNFEFNQAL
jgi:ABC-type phosphate/phosphonate transport system ATPase subunit